MRRLCVAALVLLFGLCGGISAKAGAMPPCISATLSANGNALVVNELAYGDWVGMGRKVDTSTYRVFRSYRDPNSGLRVNGPDKYWAGAFWEVVFTAKDRGSALNFCSYALVTDDAQYLVLVGADINPAALSIYRRDDGMRPSGSIGPPGGVLVRQILLSDLSPEVKVPMMMTDHTSQWFSSGTFSFSDNERTLIFTTTDGKRLHINLLTGEVQC
jgi:hypothetical protein